MNIGENRASINLCHEKIMESSEERMLGVIVQNNLKFASHVEKVKSSTFHNLFKLRRLQHVLSPAHLKMIAEGTVQSQIRYCLSVYGAEYLRLSDSDPRTGPGTQLQTIQNNMLRVITKNRLCDRVKISNMLQTTGLLSVNQMIGYGIIMEMWKARNFCVPHLGSLHRRGRDDTRTLRSDSNENVFATTPDPFSVCAEKLWNSASKKFRDTNLLKVAKVEAKQLARLLPV